MDYLAERCYEDNTVKPVFYDQPMGPQKVVLYDRWSFIRDINM